MNKMVRKQLFITAEQNKRLKTRRPQPASPRARSSAAASIATG